MYSVDRVHDFVDAGYYMVSEAMEDVMPIIFRFTLCFYVSQRFEVCAY